MTKPADRFEVRFSNIPRFSIIAVVTFKSFPSTVFLEYRELLLEAVHAWFALQTNVWKCQNATTATCLSYFL